MTGYSHRLHRPDGFSPAFRVWNAFRIRLFMISVLITDQTIHSTGGKHGRHYLIRHLHFPSTPIVALQFNKMKFISILHSAIFLYPLNALSPKHDNVSNHRYCKDICCLQFVWFPVAKYHIPFQTVDSTNES